MQHDRAGKAPDGPQAGGTWAWTSWKPASRSLPKAISRRWTQSAASSPGSRWRRWRAPARWMWNAPPALCAQRSRPRIHTFIATSDIHLKYKLKKTPAAGARRGRRGRRTGAPLRRRRGVLGRGRHPHRPRLPGEVSQGGGRRRRPHGEPARYGRLLDARGVRRTDRPHRAGARRSGHRQRTLPRRSRAGQSPTRWPRCRPARGRSSAPSTASASAPATARSKRSSWRFKSAQDRLPYHTGIDTEHLYPASQMLTEHHHLRPAAEQGHRRRQRVRARGRHPPGRLPQGEDHLRDHRSATRRRARRPAGARQAQRPPRAPRNAARTLASSSRKQELDAVYQRFIDDRRPQEGRDGRGDRRADPHSKMAKRQRAIALGCAVAADYRLKQNHEPERSRSARRRHRHAKSRAKPCACSHRVAAKFNHTLHSERRPAGRHRHSQDRHAAPGRDGAAGRRSRRDADGRGRAAGVRQRAAGEAAREGTARHSQGAGRLRQPAPGARLRGAARFLARSRTTWSKART